MMSERLREEFTTLLHDYVPDLRISGVNAAGRVPWRDDEHPSFSANLEKCAWYDHATKESGGVKEFKARLGLNGAGSQQHRIITAGYPYYDEQKNLLYEVVRYSDKTFTQRRPNLDGKWIYNLNGVRRVLYKLPSLRMAETVYVVEGEKDADRLWSIGFPATTNPHGAGKWRDEYSQSLRGKKVVILPDNDEAGEQHAQAVARSLLGKASAVKIVRLPGLPDKGDVSDWFDAGHTKDELTTLVKAAPILKPEDVNGAPTSRNSLTLTKLSDLLNEPEEHVDWLVDKLLPAGGFSLLVAKPKAGKSTLARNLALAVARGDSFLNRTTQHGAVLYLALEEKRAEVRKHFKEMGATGEEEIYIHAASAPADALEQVRAIAQEKKPVLILVDPLFRFTRVKDGNDYATMTAALEPLLILARETGAHVLCVHHAGKGEREGGDVILGSTAIFAAVDTALIMKRSERYRTIASVQRYGEDLPETTLRFDPGTRTVSLGETKEKEEEARIGDAIVKFLEAKQAPTEEREIQEEIEGRKAVKVASLRQLLDERKVCRQKKFPDKEGTRGNPYFYALDECWFASSQHIYGNQGTSNGKSDLTPQKDLSNAGSRQQVLFDEAAKNREPAFSSVPGDEMTAWGWFSQLSEEQQERWYESRNSNETTEGEER